jgi:integrase
MSTTQMNDFMRSVMACIKEQRKITDSTANQYIQTLYKLNGNKPFTTLAWTKKFDDVQKIIDTYAVSTRLNQYAVLVSALSCYKDKPTYKNGYIYWRNKMLLTVEDRRKQPEHEKSEKQEENMIPWEDIKKKASELREEISSYPLTKKLIADEFNKITDCFILSLYTEIQPRRNADYHFMCVVKKDGKTAPTDKNYYDMKEGKFYFNKYKTAKKYGQQVIDVPDSLKSLIELYLKFHPLAKGKWTNIPLLVTKDGEAYKNTNEITRKLNRIFKKKIGSSLLRHIFLSDKYADNTKERQMDSEAMGHSVSQQSEYVKY